MKRFVTQFLILLLTFAAGVTLTVAWFNFNNSTRISQNETSDLPIYSFCEFANNPEKYDGKIVRLSASINMLNIHGYTIFDSAKCSGVEDSAKNFGAIKFSNEQDCETINNIFRDNLPKIGWYKSVNVVARVMFSYVKSKGVMSDSAWDRTPLHFEILQLETTAMSNQQ